LQSQLLCRQHACYAMICLHVSTTVVMAIAKTTPTIPSLLQLRVVLLQLLFLPLLLLLLLLLLYLWRLPYTRFVPPFY